MVWWGVDVYVVQEVQPISWHKLCQQMVCGASLGGTTVVTIATRELWKCTCGHMVHRAGIYVCTNSAHS
jgi:hypothetical protein